MKKISFFNVLFFIAAIFLTGVSLTSCGSDGDDNKKNPEQEKKSLLLGTWHMDEVAIDATHSWGENKITFNSDGTLERVDILHQSAGMYSITQENKSEGQYSYNENTATLTALYKRVSDGSSWTQSYTVVELTDKKLVLTGIGSGNGLSFTFFYERVN